MWNQLRPEIYCPPPSTIFPASAKAAFVTLRYQEQLAGPVVPQSAGRSRRSPFLHYGQESTFSPSMNQRGGRDGLGAKGSLTCQSGQVVVLRVHVQFRCLNAAEHLRIKR